MLVWHQEPCQSNARAMPEQSRKCVQHVTARPRDCAQAPNAPGQVAAPPRLEAKPSRLPEAHSGRANMQGFQLWSTASCTKLATLSRYTSSHKEGLCAVRRTRCWPCQLLLPQQHNRPPCVDLCLLSPQVWPQQRNSSGLLVAARGDS